MYTVRTVPKLSEKYRTGTEEVFNLITEKIRGGGGGGAWGGITVFYVFGVFLHFVYW